MKCNGNAFNALRIKRGKYLRGKVKPCRRRGNTANMLRINRLIAFAVLKFLGTRSFPLHIRRHRGMPKFVEEFH